MKRVIFASADIALKVKLTPKKLIEVYSFFPHDPPGCVCEQQISTWKDRLLLAHPKNREDEVNKAGPLICPRSKVGMKRYKIVCKNCNEIQGYCWATDNTLTDFCDFHYYNYTDGIQWYGCLTPNVSPIDGKLTLECMCGNDTRDFRANQTLSKYNAEQIEKDNSIGREYGKPESKFKVLPA